ncbi:uncharacterized protein LOC134213997 isoform X2 [Armigeres subalbatus]|uniref:uncharacterized protein LOC134213997 isoform X2 n=1 Tax=Armigeres subalbatus TaxID=124917 RepID=UPI002ED692C1
MSVKEIYFNKNANFNESVVELTELAPKKVVPLTEELLHEKHCTISEDVQQQLISFEQRLLNVEARIDRLHDICEECVQSIQVECGSELASVVSSVQQPSETEEVQERQIMKYIAKKEDTAGSSVSLNEQYEREKSLERVREANIHRMRRNKQYRDLLLNGVSLNPCSCKRFHEELPTSCSRDAPDVEKICKFK